MHYGSHIGYAEEISNDVDIRSRVGRSQRQNADAESHGEDHKEDGLASTEYVVCVADEEHWDQLCWHGVKENVTGNSGYVCLRDIVN